jgi:hypothetical protein
MSPKELLAASVAALILACVANWAIADTHAHVTPKRRFRSNDSGCKAAAHRALRGLFVHVQLSEFPAPNVQLALIFRSGPFLCRLRHSGHSVPTSDGIS